MAIAVEYVFAPTFPGAIDISVGVIFRQKDWTVRRIYRTSNLQVSDAINVESRVGDTADFTRFHGACSKLR